MPVIDGGGQRFQPVWYEDLGAAILKAIELPELSGQTLELAGNEITTMSDVIERLSRITGRTPATISVPTAIASLGAKLFDGNSLGEEIKKLTGLDVPFDEAKLTMLLEENLIREGRPNALTEVFHVRPTSLDEGLRILADAVPEQLPEEGTGGLERKRFWADIGGSAHTPQGLLKLFRERCQEVMPLEFAAEPGAPRTIKRGLTLTASLPARGHIQMKVVEANERRVTLATVEGHPLAGVVQFSAAREGGAVRFLVEIHARAANAFDWLAMSTVGAPMQDANWVQVVERVVGLSEGNIFQGELALEQMFFQRPVSGWAQYRTPIDGFYQCGSGTHPGGGVMGASGRNAAATILKERA
jgi:NADH dehydrogenase